MLCSPPPGPEHPPALEHEEEAWTRVRAGWPSDCSGGGRLVGPQPHTAPAYVSALLTFPSDCNNENVEIDKFTLLVPNKYSVL